MSALHKPYRRAVWRGTLPVDTAGDIALFLDTEEGTLRFRMTRGSAINLAQSILDYGAMDQSTTSAGMPRADGSTPLDGEKV